MAWCPVCERPVVIDPVLLSDGRLVHAECVAKLAAEDSRPRSGSRIRVARPKKETGSS
jgi:hypothetical protein